jgi:hypothetical protein
MHKADVGAKMATPCFGKLGWVLPKHFEVTATWRDHPVQHAK